MSWKFLNSKLTSVQYFNTFDCSIQICWFHILSAIELFTKFVSTCKEKHGNKRLLSQLNEFLKDFITGYDTNIDAIEN